MTGTGAGDDWRRTPGQGRYAHAEHERRFLLAGDPPGGGEPRRIEDRYVTGTRLRLRRVEVGDDVVHKLTQKVRADEADPFAVMTTNAYLTAEEYAVLVALPAATLTKTRRVVEAAGRRWAVDEYVGHLAGLRLAETEVGADEPADADLAPPPWLGEEVTHDDRYSGGHLARADGPPVRPDRQNPSTRA